MALKTEFKVGLFIAVTTLLILASIGYVAYKKDVFSKVYTYTLSSATGENIAEGTPVVFWGFNIGHVTSMELTENGVMVRIKIAERYNNVIRAGSRFVLEKPLFGSSRIIVYTDDLKGPTLPVTAIPRITVSDDIAELITRIQTIAEKMDKMAGNVTAISENISNPQGDINRILKNAEKVTSLLAEKESIGEMLLGDKESIKSIRETIGNMKEITDRTDGVIKKIDSLTAKADEQINGSEGVLTLVRNALKDLTLKLAKIEVTLDNINHVSDETVAATKDLMALRNEVDEMVMSIRNLVDDLDRIVPFKEKKEISLP